MEQTDLRLAVYIAAMLLLLKCYDIKMVKSLGDLTTIGKGNEWRTHKKKNLTFDLFAGLYLGAYDRTAWAFIGKLTTSSNAEGN